VIIKLPKLSSLSPKVIVLTLFALVLLMQGANLASNLLFATNSNVKPPSGERDPNIAMQEHIAKLEEQIAALTSRLAQQPTPLEAVQAPAQPMAVTLPALDSKVITPQSGPQPKLSAVAPRRSPMRPATQQPTGTVFIEQPRNDLDMSGRPWANTGDPIEQQAALARAEAVRRSLRP
jgi:hypothetical protein